MNNSLERRSDGPVSEAGRKIEAALAKLRHAAEASPMPVKRRGRLIFGLDLTGSREASLHEARIATAAMFAAIQTIGEIEIRLVYFRGADECRASVWHNDATLLCRHMESLSCESGQTQIARLLRLALREESRVDALIFVGDQCEEEPKALTGLAAKLGQKSVPVFVFHECADDDQRSLEAKPVFKGIAAASGGVYCDFKSTSGAALRELLSTLAAFSSAGKDGMTQMSRPTTVAARHLQSRLLALPAPDNPEHGAGSR